MIDGQVVIVGAFRLCGMLAIVLGGYYGGKTPLLPACGGSGNSVIGDSLFPGEKAVEKSRALIAASLVISILRRGCREGVVLDPSAATATLWWNTVVASLDRNMNGKTQGERPWQV